MLLCPVQEREKDAVKALLKTRMQEKIEDPEIFTAQVSKFAPLTRAQFDDWNSLWPTSFHDTHRYGGSRLSPPGLLQSSIGTFFPSSIRAKDLTPEDFAAMEGWMDHVLKRGTDQREYAILVDPTRKEIVAEASEDTAHHPLKHAIIRCIDLFGERLLARLENLAPPPEVEGGESAVRGVKRKFDDEKNPAGSHLCNGLQLYTNMEPCTMCSMALVHSRIDRVSYAIPDPHFGGLGGRYKVHTQRGLNHHFEVYRYLGDASAPQ